MQSARFLLLMVVIMASTGIFLLVQGVAISAVTVSKADELPGTSLKSIGMINLPQVPEFPKLATRPGKSPSGSSSSNKHNNNQQQQQQQQQQAQQSSASPSPHYQQQQQYQQPSPQQYQQYPSASSSSSPYQTNLQNLIPPFGLPGGIHSSVPVTSSGPEAFSSEYQHESVPSVHFQEAGNELEEESAEEDQREDYAEYAMTPEEEVEEDGYHQESTSLEVETTIQAMQEQPVIVSVSSKDESTSSNNGKLVDMNQEPLPAPQPEKIQQESPPEFAMPQHVLNILQALGGGGSLAQASKPEKQDNSGQQLTTASAMGYATGDNANVNASVSNRIEFNPQTVILTESASASASSASNGTAFSQATLASNNYNQYGPGSGWKSNNKNTLMP